MILQTRMIWISALPHIPVPVPAGAVQSSGCSHDVSEDPGLTHCVQGPAQRTV